MIAIVIGCFVLLTVFLIYLAICDTKRKNSYKIISVARVDKSYDYLITLENIKEQLIKYRGSGTVWHNAETGQRTSTPMESVLSDIYTKHKWKESA